MTVDHRTDELFDAYFAPGGERVAVYRNKDRTHFKLTITEDISASVELDRDRFVRLLGMMGYAMGPA